jgi:hypothetical protein
MSFCASAPSKKPHEPRSSPRRIHQQQEPWRLPWCVAELLLDLLDQAQVVPVGVDLQYRLYVANGPGGALRCEEGAAIKIQQRLLGDARWQATSLRVDGSQQIRRQRLEEAVCLSGSALPANGTVSNETFLSLSVDRFRQRQLYDLMVEARL